MSSKNPTTAHIFGHDTLDDEQGQSLEPRSHIKEELKMINIERIVPTAAAESAKMQTAQLKEWEGEPDFELLVAKLWECISVAKDSDFADRVCAELIAALEKAVRATTDRVFDNIGGEDIKVRAWAAKRRAELEQL